MFAHPKLTATRRWKRRVKAAASIAIALAAGTFLACQRHLATITGDASPGKADEGARDAVADAPASLDASPTEAGAADAPFPPSSTALAIYDAGHAKARSRSPAVDVNEHRKGMPVPDNLLE